MDLVIKMKDCLFCQIANGKSPCYCLYEDDLVIAFLDINPSTDGHTLIVPKKHYADFMEVDTETMEHMLKVELLLTPHLMKTLKVTSLALTINYGDSQLIKPVHLHLIPNNVLTHTGHHNKEEVTTIYNQLKKS